MMSDGPARGLEEPDSWPGLQSLRRGGIAQLREVPRLYLASFVASLKEVCYNYTHFKFISKFVTS